MSVLFFDGFDHYTGSTEKWDVAVGSPVISGSYARTGGGGIRLSGTSQALQADFSSFTGVVIGEAVKVEVAPTFSTTTPQWEFKSGGTTQVSAYITSDNKISAYRDTGSTLIGTSTNALTAGAWGYVELHVEVGGAGTGSVACYLDGTQEFSQTADTDPAATGNLNRVVLSGTNTAYQMDDVYILSTTGSSNTGVLGDSVVNLQTPNDSGTYSEWTPLSGGNYTNVDENPPDGNTTYVSTSGSVVDTYQFSGTVDDNTVYAVQVSNMVRGDSGTQTVYGAVASGTPYYAPGTGTVVESGTSYAVATEVFDLNPHTRSAWTKATVDNYQFGISTVTTPDAFSDLELWLDGSDVSTMYQTTDTSTPVTADGQTLGRLEDKSGNGNHFTQGTAAEEPTYKTAIKNGLSVVRFDGSNDDMTSVTTGLISVAGGAMDAFIVFTIRTQPTSLSRPLFSTRTSTGANTGFEFLLRSNADSGLREIWPLWGKSGVFDIAQTTTQPGANLGTFYILEAYRNGTNAIVRVNASQEDSVTDNKRDISTSTASYLGALNATSSWCHYDMAEIIIYNRLLTSSERTLIETYLSKKWGITLP